jgi:hypothetical protein
MPRVTGRSLSAGVAVPEHSLTARTDRRLAIGIGQSLLGCPLRYGPAVADVRARAQIPETKLGRPPVVYVVLWVGLLSTAGGGVLFLACRAWARLAASIASDWRWAWGPSPGACPTFMGSRPLLTCLVALRSVPEDASAGGCCSLG